MDTIDFPAKLTFRPQKAPYKSVTFMDEFIKCESQAEPKLIKHQEARQFKDDTRNLLEMLAELDLRILVEKPDLNQKLIEEVTRYWTTWGPIFPWGDNMMSIPVLLELGKWFFLAKTFWNDDSAPDPLAKVIIEDLIKNWNLTVPGGKGVAYWKVEYWPDTKQIVPFPLSDRKQASGFSDFTIVVKHPNRNEIGWLQLVDKNKTEWLRQAILDRVADYITKTGVTFTASLKRNEMHLTGSTNNLFLAYLMSELVVVGQRHIKLCECGCGNPVPPGSWKYYDPKKCKERLARRSIANWLTTRKSRGQLTKEKYELLMEEVDDLIMDGNSEQKIKKMIEPKVYKVKK